MHARCLIPLLALAVAFSAPARAGYLSETRSASSRAVASEPTGPDRFEISLGYNYIHLDDAFPETEHLHGVDVSAFFNINSWLSLGGDFMANFGERSVQPRFFFGNVDV